MCENGIINNWYAQIDVATNDSYQGRSRTHTLHTGSLSVHVFNLQNYGTAYTPVYFSLVSLETQDMVLIELFIREKKCSW